MDRELARVAEDPEAVGDQRRELFTSTRPDASRLPALPLGADGGLRGDPERDGWTWRIHESSVRSLYLGRVDDPLRDPWTLFAARPGELDLVSPEAIRGFERWRKR